jgi:hypothetical protein
MRKEREEIKNRNLAEWNNVLNEIFDGKTPQDSEWYDVHSISVILNRLGIDQLNHMFLPSGGGMDLAGAKLSNEPGCIELISDGGNFMVLKPKKLSFYWFGKDNIEWAYFRIETARLEPSGVYDDYDTEFFRQFQLEEVTELKPGKYVDRSVYDAGYYGYDENGEKPLPDEARTVARIFSGDFVIFPKLSFYNIDLSDPYDARHNKMTANEFKQYVEKIISKLEESR